MNTLILLMFGGIVAVTLLRLGMWVFRRRRPKPAIELRDLSALAGRKRR